MNPICDRHPELVSRIDEGFGKVETNLGKIRKWLLFLTVAVALSSGIKELGDALKIASAVAAEAHVSIDAGVEQ